jgi:uncharacterized protein YraI
MSRSTTRSLLAGWVAAMSFAAVLLVPATAHAADRTVTVNAGGSYINVRSDPTTTSSVVRRLPTGARVSITCHVRSETFAGGPYGVRTNVWNKITGRDEWMWDGMLETGSNDPVVPVCGSTTSVEFALPFPAGATYTVTQAPGGSYSHSDAYNRHAIDLGNGRSGGSVVAAGAGRIHFEGWNGAAGITALVDHGNNRCTQYAHLSSTIVDRGQTVRRGQKIGTVGGSGNGRMDAYSPHLHFNLVYCDTQRSREIVRTVERGTSYPTGAAVTSRNG